MSRWIAVPLCLVFVSAALAAPPLPQTDGLEPTTDWQLERGVDNGVAYVAVIASNATTDAGLQLTCAADGSVGITLFDEPKAPLAPAEAATITTRVPGLPARKDMWEQSVDEDGVRSFELQDDDVYDLVTALARAATGEARFEVTAGRSVSRYAFDLSTGAEERGLLAATCSAWRSGSDL